MDKASIKAALKAQHPRALDMFLDPLIELYMKHPELVVEMCKKCKQADRKAAKKKAAAEPEKPMIYEGITISSPDNTNKDEESLRIRAVNTSSSDPAPGDSELPCAE